MKKVLIAYVPVLHEGYLKFFMKHADARFFILGHDFSSELDYFRKEIRALDPEVMKRAIDGLRIFDSTSILERRNLEQITFEACDIIMADEDITRHFKTKYLPDKDVVFDQVFLRWNKNNVLEKSVLTPDRIVSHTAMDREFLSLAEAETKKSSDWWRQVGAVVVRDGEVILISYNRHVPSPHMPYADGDPRSLFKKGKFIEVSTAHHAERRLIAEAARRADIGLEGAYLYVTTFPCPPCAKQVAYSGIKRCYYRTGYAMLDGERILRHKRVEIIKVDF